MPHDSEGNCPKEEIVIVCLLSNNKNRRMNRKYLFLIISLTFISMFSCSGGFATLMPDPSRKAASYTNTLGVTSYYSAGGEKGSTSVLRPTGSIKPDSQTNTSNPTSNYFGVDSQGNTSILTPNNSRGYIGLDKQGNAVIITPLRGNLGVDSNGNIWTIRPR